MIARVTVLGSGTSHGVPMIGCTCAVCTSLDPRDRRTRPSIMVEDRGTRVLVDSGPDVREQLIAAGATWLSAVLFTHSHADHTHGMDDLRGINIAMSAPIDIYADRGTLEDLKQ